MLSENEYTVHEKNRRIGQGLYSIKLNYLYAVREAILLS